MDKTEAIIVCESFRTSVMLSVNTMQITPELKAEILIKFQAFYLTTLKDLLATPPPVPKPIP